MDLKMRIALRVLPKECIHHMGRDSQNCSYDHQKALCQNSYVESYKHNVRAEWLGWYHFEAIEKSREHPTYLGFEHTTMSF